MKSRDFCYWLQGFFELTGDTPITSKQSDIIRRHLNLVFQHDIDPTMNGPNNENKPILDAIHSPTDMSSDSSSKPIYRC